MKLFAALCSVLFILICCTTDDGLPQKNLTIGNAVTAQWSARQAHTMLNYKNALWVLGGNTSQSSYLNDVWTSTDGQNWQEVMAAAAWEGRRNHSSVVFDGKMWVIGGRSNTGGFLNDVWYSENGIEWTPATSNAQWAPRSAHTTVVHNGELFLIGGTNGSSTYQDVWKSLDGITWQQVTGPSGMPWPARQEHHSFSFDGKMWVVGGSSATFSALDDVWQSTDGVSWILATDNPGWVGSASQVCLVYNNNIWLLSEDKPLGDEQIIWCSTDGITWQHANTVSAWGDREQHAGTVFNNKMYISGGFKNQALQDIIELE